VFDDQALESVFSGGEGYALVVGINAADDGRQFAERDAEAVYASLISPEGGNFSPGQVRKLTGPEATVENFRLELETWLQPSATPADRILIFYAGPGVVGTGAVGSLTFHPGPTGSGEGSTYPLASFAEAVGAIQAQQKTVLVDAARSGDLTGVFRQSAGNAGGSLFALAAGRVRETARESEEWGGGHGAFTHYLVRALGGGADQSRDGAVTAGEVLEYVRQNVREATGNAQTPTADGPDFDPELILAYVPSSVRPDPPPAPEFATLVIESVDPEATLIVDGRVENPAEPGVPLRLGGLRPGVHTIRAVRTGHDAFGPEERMLYPGQLVTIRVPALPVWDRPEAAVRAFDDGFEDYLDAGYADAIGHFETALASDPEYAVAADFLARSHHHLFEFDEARRYFQRAIEIDPGAVETMTRYAGMLMDVGEGDEAIRQLTAAVQADPDDAVAHYLLSEAFRRNGNYDEALVHGRRSIAIEPNLAEAHFWLAEGLRLTGDYESAKGEYAEYLRLSDFDSGLAGDLNYWVLGFLFGGGERTRSSREDVWEELQRDAWFGLCDAEFLLMNFDAALGHCRRAVGYDPQHVYSHYRLGQIYSEQANLRLDAGDVEDAARLGAAALQRFNSMLEINPYLDPEADFARRTVESIAEFLASR
jgi:tetratricopeptide (TPR) repeat protein